MMSRPCAARILGLALAGLALCTVAGCTEGSIPEHGEYGDQAIPPNYVSQETRDETILPLDGSGGGLGVTQRLALGRFIAALAPGQPGNLHLDLDGPQAGVMAARAAAIDAGVDPVKIAWVPPPAGDETVAARPAARVHVVGSVWHPAFPKCPRESQYLIGGGTNPGASDFGCATRSDLEAMVTDPRDLLRGESGGETDGVLTSAAIDRLHQDKVKKIETTGVKAAGSGQ